MSDADASLAPYAEHEERSRGRRYEEATPRHRGEFQRGLVRLL